MKQSREQHRKMELFLEGLGEKLSSDELHHYVDLSLRIDELLDRRIAVRKKSA